MKISPIKTKLVRIGDDLNQLLINSLPKSVPEKSIIVVTSKVVALCEGAVAPLSSDRSDKHQLVRQQAELYLDPHSSKYDLMITIRDNLVAVNAGIDESNADGQYVLFPEDSYKSAQQIWSFLKDHFVLKELGVLITDSKTIPLKWGTVGAALAHCGFRPLNDKRGEKDLFGHEMVMTQVNVAEALAAASVLVMGEVAESQPIAIIEDADMIEFMDRPLNQGEITELIIEIENDVFAPLISNVNWQPGGRKRNEK